MNKIQPLFVKIKTVPDFDDNKMRIAGYKQDDNLDTLLLAASDLICEQDNDDDEDLARLFGRMGAQLMRVTKYREIVLDIINNIGPTEDKYPITKKVIHELIEEDNKLIKKMSLTPELCKIATLALAYGEDGDISCATIETIDEEVSMLEKFWASTNFHTNQNNIYTRKIVGYNHTKFDLACILTRSIMLEVLPSPSRRAVDSRPWGNDIIDLAECREKWLFWGELSKRSIQFMAESYELDSLSDYTDLVDEYLKGEDTLVLLGNNPELLKAYCSNDLYWIQQLYGKMKGYFFNE